MGLFGSESSPIAVLDLGSHQARVLIANLFPDGELEMVGYGQRKSVGVSEGTIINPKWAEQSIADAVACAENLAGINIQRMTVGLNTKMTHSTTITLEQSLGGQAITPELRNHLRQAAEQQASHRLPQGGQWAHLHVIPLGYSIDGSEPTDIPDGLFGANLQAQFHIVSVPMTSIQNLRECLLRNGIETERFILSPYAAGLSTLDPALREYGATLIDLGAETTSIVSFGRWKLLQTAVLPVGGGDITNDVAQHFGFNQDRAEKLKVTEGNLAASLSVTSALEAASLFDSRGFEHAELNPVVEARMREILMAVQETLSTPRFARYQTHSLAFTGAGSYLKGLQAYAEAMFHDKRIRLAHPVSIPGAPEAIRTAGFATATGLLKYMAKWRQQYAPQGILSRKNAFAPQNLPVVRRLFAK